MEITPQVAIEQYTDALKRTGENPDGYQFRCEYGRVCIGVPSPQLPGGVQWGMDWHTPETLAKMAKMRVLLHNSPEFDIRTR